MYLPIGHALMNCNDQGMTPSKAESSWPQAEMLAVLHGQIRASNDKHCPNLAVSKSELYGTSGSYESRYPSYRSHTTILPTLYGPTQMDISSDSLARLWQECQN